MKHIPNYTLKEIIINVMKVLILFLILQYYFARPLARLPLREPLLWTMPHKERMRCGRNYGPGNLRFHLLHPNYFEKKHNWTIMYSMSATFLEQLGLFTISMHHWSDICRWLLFQRTNFKLSFKGCSWPCVPSTKGKEMGKATLEHVKMVLFFLERGKKKQILPTSLKWSEI